MDYFKDLIAYHKDNPQGYWFKRKLYGWGWTPVTWQGWLVTFGFIATILLFATALDETATARDAAFTFFLPILLLTVAFIRIAYKKGEPPKWQWGIPKKEDHQKD